MHLIIANFCTWFEGKYTSFYSNIVFFLLLLLAIVFETLEQLHANTDSHSTTIDPTNVTYSTTTGMQRYSDLEISFSYFF
jgi:hypothetical protein